MSKRPPSSSSTRSVSHSPKNDRTEKVDKNEEFLLDCKAAYLTVYDDLTDNIISKRELQSALQQTGRNPTQKSLDRYWRSDTKFMNFDDFCTVVRVIPSTSEQELLKAFQQLDLNGDGYITHNELYKMMTSRGEKMSPDEVEKIIDEVDENKDGKLEYAEFCKLVMSTTDEVKDLARQKLKKSGKKKPNTSSSSGTGRRPSKSPRRRESKAEGASPRPVKGEASPRSKERENGDRDHTASPKPAPRPRSSATRSTSSGSKTDESRRSDQRRHSPVCGRKVRLPEPRMLREWRHLMKKGVVHLAEDESLISHKYTLTLSEDTDVWITVQPKPLHPDAESSRAPVDVSLIVINSVTGKVVTISEQRDNKGRYCLRCDLSKGNYTLIPFSTGCRLKRRKNEPKSTSKLVKKDGDQYILSKAFREALLEIFEISDLDGNGLLSREEFDLYNVRTSGEHVTDGEWEVVEENIELKDGQITMKGFIQLIEMEAEDSEGDTGDLWVTLNSMGFNKTLTMDEACPFVMDIYFEEDDEAVLKVIGFSEIAEIEKALTHIIINKGDVMKVSKDVNMHIYANGYNSSYVAENNSRSKQCVEIAFSGSLNCAYSKGEDTDILLVVPGKATSQPLFVLPQNDRLEWTVRYMVGMA